MRTFFISILLVTASTLSATPMVRVVDVIDARTLVVDRDGVAVTVHLAGIALAPSDEAAAASYLRAKVASAWVLAEDAGNGEVFLYRSPDGLFVNGDLNRRPFATGTLNAVYLGEAMPAPNRVERTSEKRPAAKKETAAPKLIHHGRSTPIGSHHLPRL